MKEPQRGDATAGALVLSVTGVVLVLLVLVFVVPALPVFPRAAGIVIGASLCLFGGWYVGRQLIGRGGR